MAVHLTDRGRELRALHELVDALAPDAPAPSEISLRPESAGGADRIVDGGSDRSDLRGTLLVVLSNDDEFLLSLDEEVDTQHEGLLTLTQLPVPDSRTKETVVRVNTNRLNPVSYWFCVDKGGPQEKVAIRQALEGAGNFPDAFGAVDTAVRSRIGRPARKNVITLIALANLDDATSVNANAYGDLQRTEVRRNWLAMHTFASGWAPIELGERETGFLESEWDFRLVVVGSSFVRSLIEIVDGRANKRDHVAAVGELLDALSTFHGPGTRQTTRDAYSRSIEDMIRRWPASTADLDAFWAQGIVRSTTYELALSEVLEGYNTGGETFLGYRPDHVIQPYRACSVVEAVADTSEAITAAIRREAHVFEFTALNAYTDAAVKHYLLQKLPNYIEITQEQ